MFPSVGWKAQREDAAAEGVPAEDAEQRSNYPCATVEFGMQEMRTGGVCVQLRETHEKPHL